MEGFREQSCELSFGTWKKWTEQRRSIAQTYNQLLDKYDVEPPVEMKWARHAVITSIRSDLRIEMVCRGRRKRRESRRRCITVNQYIDSRHIPIWDIFKARFRNRKEQLEKCYLCLSFLK